MENKQEIKVGLSLEVTSGQEHRKELPAQRKTIQPGGGGEKRVLGAAAADPVHQAREEGLHGAA